MKNLNFLSRNALRAVIGGFSSTCSTTCSNGKNIEVTCPAGCSSIDGKHVGCNGGGSWETNICPKTDKENKETKANQGIDY
ncbi:hypothetical protein HZQ11_14810 [Elizabethkingia anophelis]|uniref:hypothetical protein n=1 Tax=Elizabethkingia TaxID=308865 RepID=UPI0007399089|nr:MULTISPECIES: hypothetical protein [Elizabethkingia]KUF44177.1 hypothetical protein AS358_08015 [Elizabethkingia anophelis]MCT3644123.1 hypothetical protein [Elizabethkingia anophelis]MCT3651747.1 hypothetical protein [Elizabethkingia anophelis]MCT3655013.1 hypothetical protein [Elizabethkingia anophelis]MCT3659091.1 hypothetical protein [Elizabethkingia anophelis]